MPPTRRAHCFGQRPAALLRSRSRCSRTWSGEKSVDPGRIRAGRLPRTGLRLLLAPLGPPAPGFGGAWDKTQCAAPYPVLRRSVWRLESAATAPGRSRAPVLSAHLSRGRLSRQPQPCRERADDPRRIWVAPLRVVLRALRAQLTRTLRLSPIRGVLRRRELPRSRRAAPRAVALVQSQVRWRRVSDLNGWNYRSPSFQLGALSQTQPTLREVAAPPGIEPGSDG